VLDVGKCQAFQRLTRVAHPIYSPPQDVADRRGTALIAGIVGLVICAVGFLLDRDHFFRAYLIAYLFWLSIPLGSLALMMVHHQSGGAWGLVIRRIFEASSRTLPALAILFLPIVLGMGHLYPWTHADHVAADEILQHKAPYLNTPFFLVRALVYFATWIGLAWVLSKWSRRQDEGDLGATRRMQLISGGGLVLYGLTVTFASVDWMMSINPHWFSTMFGFLAMGGQGLAALAFAIVIATILWRREPMHTVFNPGHFHDLGKLMLAFVMLWAYFNFSQYLIIYSGNLVEEIPYYVARTSHGWQYLALVLVVFHFAAPFALLLSRDLKRNAGRLVTIAIAILVMRFVDFIFLVSPDFSASGANMHLLPPAQPGEEAHVSHFFVHWLDLAAPLGIGGIWVWLFLTQLAERPLLPVRDPHLAEALESAGSH
jgi:hypothetical protein